MSRLILNVSNRYREIVSVGSLTITTNRENDVGVGPCQYVVVARSGALQLLQRMSDLVLLATGLLQVINAMGTSKVHESSHAGWRLSSAWLSLLWVTRRSKKFRSSSVLMW